MRQLGCHVVLVAGKHGWPSSSILDHVPESEDDQSTLIDTLQDWKSLKYQEIIGKRFQMCPPTWITTFPAQTMEIKPFLVKLDFL